LNQNQATHFLPSQPQPIFLLRLWHSKKPQRWWPCVHLCWQGYNHADVWGMWIVCATRWQLLWRILRVWCFNVFLKYKTHNKREQRSCKTQKAVPG
jgi:hypothetical protein